jgi:hypothetical protein
MAPLNNVLVLFGGDGYSDTWVWNGTTWTELDVTGPSERGGAVMGQLGGKLFLFGGFDTSRGGNTQSLSDMWSFDGARWNEIAGPKGPLPRDSAVMAPLGDNLVLFGGEACNGATYDTCQTFADTWLWDGTAWTELQLAAAPPPRVTSVMSPLAGTLVLYGGYPPDPTICDYLSDTWIWDGTVWTQSEASNPLPALVNASMAGLPSTVVVSGGIGTARDGGCGTTSDFLGTGIWDGSSWADPAPPGPPGHAYNVMATLCVGASCADGGL